MKGSSKSSQPSSSSSKPNTSSNKESSKIDNRGDSRTQTSQMKTGGRSKYLI